MRQCDCGASLVRSHGHRKCARCRMKSKGASQSAEDARVAAERDFFVELTAEWARTTLRREFQRSMAEDLSRRCSERP